MNPAIVASGLTRNFGDFIAVDHISFAIESGSVWGFLGPNGAGKSTTIRMVCGVLAPTSGGATVLGYDVASQPEPIKSAIGYMSQKSGVWPDLTVREHVELFGGIYGLDTSTTRTRMQYWMERFELRPVADELAARLPGGFRQRLAFVCAALHDPKILFLDEPTAGVDPISRRQFWDIIGTLSGEGTTVVVTTHYLDEAEHCNRLAFINDGRIAATGTPDELKHDPRFGLAMEIRAPGESTKALALVEGLPFVRGATLFGDALHVMLAQEGDAVRLSQVIADAGLRASAPVAAEPTLEDVFASALSSAAGSPR
jgi:ABC-2 type transport system ATP-binding protein